MSDPGIPHFQTDTSELHVDTSKGLGQVATVGPLVRASREHEINRTTCRIRF